MSEGSETIIAAVILALAAIFALILWVELRRPGKVVIDEPYGDASDTPKMIHNARRVNHERVK
jgi:hypothetical protein